MSITAPMLSIYKRERERKRSHKKGNGEREKETLKTKPSELHAEMQWKEEL